MVEQIIWLDLFKEMQNYFWANSFSDSKIFLEMPITSTVLQYPFMVFEFIGERNLLLYDNGLNNEDRKEIEFNIYLGAKNTDLISKKRDKALDSIYQQQRLLRNELYNYILDVNNQLGNFIYYAKINSIEPVQLANNNMKMPIIASRFNITLEYNIAQGG